MKIVGNNKPATVLILVFILILCALSWRCSQAAEIVVRGGASFGGGETAPVLGLDLRIPQGNAVDLYAGTMLWGDNQVTGTNWDWHAGFRTCRGPFCASLGAAYVQVVDHLNGSHTNFALGLSYALGHGRFQSIDLFHLSNAGTVMPNIGRNAVVTDFRLQ